MTIEAEYNLFKSLEGKCIGKVSLALQEHLRVSEQRDMKVTKVHNMLDILIAKNICLELKGM